MKFEAVTIKDIAKALGLSTSTVSRALRDSYEISPETKKVVLEYAEKLNYHPNPIALSLKERRSRSIGVIVCEIANSYFSQVINGIESIANTNGYNVIISQSHESAEKELVNLQYLTSRSVDGLIISVSTETKDFNYFNELHDRGMPIVFFDRIVDEIQTHKVIADNFKGAYDATTHLINSGYKRIATLCNTVFLSIGKERLAGYQAALKDHGLEPDESLIRYCQHGGMVAEEMDQAMDELFTLQNPPDAIFAAADKLTTGCLRALRAKGLSVPEDVGLIGFSNSELTELLNPSLSVIRQPAFEMGEVATSLLLELIESKRPVTDFQSRVLTTEMILRSSTRMQKTHSKPVIS
ncbi:MAG TPA: LacI family DNA-binding transcriptional regulator [Chitinophagaceae bacterium]|nr:LacI family DNA-binding transcriptional regulator [Chitinophagaceae bacterium]HPH30286.1 LacI family DNA-binding transcriptional regulator [Chitinophagaceae bacterium]HPN59622.1 LacI family DNA-binding transcriptional regulator [Chitinophagaceae bacterium]